MKVFGILSHHPYWNTYLSIWQDIEFSPVVIHRQDSGFIVFSPFLRTSVLGEEGLGLWALWTRNGIGQSFGPSSKLSFRLSCFQWPHFSGLAMHEGVWNAAFASPLLKHIFVHMAGHWLQQRDNCLMLCAIYLYKLKFIIQNIFFSLYEITKSYRMNCYSLLFCHWICWRLLTHLVD